jgi:hypothetical protein
MTAIKAHFDGRVLIPDETVDLPVNEPLRIVVQPVKSCGPMLRRLAEKLSRMPDDPTTPSDLAAQHDHYLHGMPKRP